MPMALYLLGIFMGAIDTGIITPARPIIANDLGVDEASGIWMLTIYTLAYAASIPVMGKFADRRGRKPVYLLSIALFGVGSLLCGLSQDMASFRCSSRLGYRPLARRHPADRHRRINRCPRRDAAWRSASSAPSTASPTSSAHPPGR